MISDITCNINSNTCSHSNSCAHHMSMQVGHCKVLSNEQTKAQGRRCKCNRSHDLTPRSFLLVALVASLYTPTNQPPGGAVDALSLPGRRLFRRHATATATDSEVELELYNYQDATSTDDDEFDFTGRSPAFTSPLFTSPSSRRNRDSRQRQITQHRRKLFRREGNFQLNYKDIDDDFLSIIESNQPFRPRIFGGLNRKSLSKALFPPVVELESVVKDVPSMDELDVSHIAEDERTFGKPTRPLQIGIGKRKKKDQVVVTNIHELHEAILDKGLELRDIDLKYAPPPSLLTSKRNQTTYELKADSAQTNSDDEVELLLMTTEHNPEFEESLMIEGKSPDIGLDEGHEPNAEEWQLIGNVLAEDNPVLAEEKSMASDGDEEQLFSHDVLNLLHQRYHSQSSPMFRAANDTATLALSIEGGGMRGAVSGGMAAAIACLGLSNCFDSIYGSSAGSIIGSYFVSRQLYLDVYTDVIPAGKDLFVSKTKIFGDMFRNAFYIMKGPLGKRLNVNLIERFRNPAAGIDNTTMSYEDLPPTREGGLNISFVLDSIMCPENGLRPLDLDVFSHNDAVQPLRIVSSAVELDSGKLKSICFGSKEGHFRDQFANPAASTEDAGDSSTDPEYVYPKVGSAEADENGFRRGLWACLGASMTVPGAAGSPFRMDLPDDKNQPTPHLCFDAFCYEPVPFRSAVAEGATHVLALRSRPAGYEPKTKPTIYERAAAPLYFRSNGVNSVAEFFENGGQQYFYAEDVLLCDHGLNSTEPIPIPPAKVLYGAPDGTSSVESKSEYDRENWARAHLLPITVPADVPELAVLSQDRDDILTGIRSGFAAAYDALAPVVGLEAGPNSLDGMKVAELVFPEADAPQESMLETQFLLAGEKLGKTLRAVTEQDIISTYAEGKELATDADLSSAPRRKRFSRLLSVRRAFRFSRRSKNHVQEVEASTSSMPVNTESSPPAQDVNALFSLLPGLQLGSIPMVAERLQSYLENNSYMEG